jgi:hypothetical protein
MERAVTQGDTSREEERTSARGDFVRTVAVAGAGLALGGIGAALLPALAGSAPAVGETEQVLNLLLLLEYQQDAFYAAAQPVASAEGGELERWRAACQAQEQIHIARLRSLMGSAARTVPIFDFGAATATPESILRTAIEIEDLAVSAYDGQLARLRGAARETAAGIASVDARHSAWAARISGAPGVAPAATDPTLSEAQVGAELARLDFMRGG